MGSSVKGRVHSFQSLGAVDGPGLRFVVFMQGCPYFCPYCHNPDTKSYSGGTEYTADEIVEKAKRFKPYFGAKGGVTVSGGEPLVQAEFVAELFEKLHVAGINTALDTAGFALTDSVKKALRHTDTVLCDIKFSTEEQYKKYIGSSLKTTLDFIEECDRLSLNVYIRHVVVPGLTDSEESVRKIAELANTAENLQKIELLPFKKLCIEKYEKLGLEFALKDTPECEPKRINELNEIIKRVNKKA